MQRRTDWLIILVCALLVVALVGWAGGPEHHRGDAVGSHGTKVVVVAPAP